MENSVAISERKTKPLKAEGRGEEGARSYISRGNAEKWVQMLSVPTSNHEVLHKYCNILIISAPKFEPDFVLRNCSVLQKFQ